MLPPAEDHQHKLKEWHRVCHQAIHGLPCELTMRQWAILLHVYLVDDTHTVKSLAEAFDLPKPSVCRALDTLSIEGLIRRRKDQNDKRNVIVCKTMKGIGFLNQFNDMLNSQRHHPHLNATPEL